MSDRRYFGTDGVRGIAGHHPMTATFALKLGVATAEILRRGGTERPQVAIGMDTRRSGPMLVHALSSGLMSRGADVISLGVIPTPGVSFLTRALGADAGIVVSASHNPYDDNGIKLFNSAGAKLSDSTEAAIEELMDHVEDGLNGSLEPYTGTSLGSHRRLPHSSKSGIDIEAYVAHLLANAPYLDGLKVVLDCANGAGHRIAPLVFNRLGGRLEVINSKPDGQNINVQCGSTHPEPLRQRVVEGGFEVGVTLDGDADRALLVDRKGRLVTGDHILAICALARGETEIVATQMSNLGVENYLKARGVTMHRAKVGDRYVFEELRKRSATLGGEQSGHVLFLDKAPAGDGILTALQVLSAARQSGKSLDQWLDEIPSYPQVLVNVAVPNGQRDKVARCDTVLERVAAAERELGAEGRVLLRPSGTEPLVRVMVEGPDDATVQRLATGVAEAVRASAAVA